MERGDYGENGGVYWTLIGLGKDEGLEKLGPKELMLPATAIRASVTWDHTHGIPADGISCAGHKHLCTHQYNICIVFLCSFIHLLVLFISILKDL